MSGIVKRFGPTEALRGVDLELRAGEIHALVGENGAGKSTLMKVLSGALVPDAGSMTLDGRPYAPADPQEARRHGVAMVYQELTLAPHLSVEANVLLGLEETRWGFLRRRAQRRRVEEALAVLQHPEIHPDSPVARLSPGARQLVEIARALLLDVRLLVLDEPTSSLSQADAQRLFGLVRRLRDRGVTVVYISHFLEEVRQLADRFTVLRDGQSVGTGAVADFTAEQIVERMVGRQLGEQYPRVPHAIGEPILRVSDLAGIELPRGVDLVVHRGEILGIAGIVGAGRTELLRAIFGLEPVRRGDIVVRALAGTRFEPWQRINHGLGLLSEDRKSEGLALPQSIADNLTYSWLRPYSRFGWLDLSRRRRDVATWLERLQVRHRDPEQPVGELSGGNQQKVALGRLLHQQADLLLLDEPTRGIDVASKAEIYRLVGELAAQGRGIVFVSSYLPELLGVCDTLAVMVRGRLSAIRPVADWTPEQVMAEATASGVT
ncbi:MAG: sugar ABC transporter ATP-binding protein [Gemmataceae bacterium]|nr:sugar ABC transporter ATP-binding protein [Gemmataceae bacterium]MDW8266284.1 sugar ABC transporter ATP-binding protein [Gemmataceae bacterium]